MGFFEDGLVGDSVGGLVVDDFEGDLVGTFVRPCVGDEVGNLVGALVFQQSDHDAENGYELKLSPRTTLTQSICISAYPITAVPPSFTQKSYGIPLGAYTKIS